jgi:hypothetical protein
MKRRTRKTRIAEGMDPARVPDEVMAPEIVDTPEEKRRAGRPSALTQEVSDRICLAISNGMFLTQAARLAGVSKNVINNWLQRAAEGDEDYQAFAEKFEEAELKSEAALIKIWKDAAPSDWRAAKELLAKRFPERWSDHAGRKAVLGDDDGVIRAGFGGLKIFIHLDPEPSEALPAPLPAIDVTSDGRLDNAKDSI